MHHKNEIKFESRCDLLIKKAMAMSHSVGACHTYAFLPYN